MTPPKEHKGDELTDYVYLLSHHDEHGSEDVVATMDRNDLPTLLRNFSGGAYYHATVEKLREVLEGGEIRERQPINLTNGWGGVQLHVVPLTATATIDDAKRVDKA